MMKTKRIAKPFSSEMLTKGCLISGYREVLSHHMIAMMLTTSAVLACTLALVGPIGFYHVESPFERVAYAALYTSLCWPVSYALFVLVYYFLRFRTPLEILAGLAFTSLFGSFQCSAMMHTIENLTHPGYPAEPGFLAVFLLVGTASLSSSILYFYVVWQRLRYIAPVAERSDIGAGVPARAPDASKVATASDGDGPNGQPPSGANDVSPPVAVEDGHTDGSDASADSQTHGNGDEPASEQAPPGTQQLAAYRPAGQPGTLLKLLPDRLGTDLIYIKSEDHYLEVHTTVGSSLIKMRFSDAVAELGDRGIQVHRSYWVATRHVIRSVRSGKRTLLRLTGDHKVPVSVTHMPAVRAALRR